ncbi:hypothetical protein C2S52_001630 [Perilla frutescens var. hirtella]|uniref:Pectinesterase inhibitor domain-containing protein n=1 Tax=Perilla frutescens var. hirtella TaxID=608512 RepID=A0AAD4IZB6_PERFH|nr:hypothetical protein C2S51_006908 [Perilla frutescens var. frutescens]KAH6801166.1 hypothetical protein C2S52_001630 [Perilla frutescens var. hirtella]KAH6824372.1 hypothetical protein C2S53_017318 [Perilla frutescens var. hirtella]
MKIQISLILLSIMILQSDAVSSSQKDQNLIETTCKNTPDYKLCTSIIRADRGAAAADVPGLGLIVVAVVKKKTQEMLATINKQSKSAAKKLLPPLRRCKEVYKAVLEGDIPVAETAIRGNPKFAETAMADARIEANLCERAFEGVAPSPFTSQNNYVENVAAVARAIIRNLL